MSAVIVIETVPPELDRRTPGQALAALGAHVPPPRPSEHWDTSEQACERVLDWLRSET